MNAAIDTVHAAPPRAEEILAVELNTYRRELGRLLSDGEEGRWVLAKGDEVVGTWDTFNDAIQVGYDRFGHTPFLVQQILAEEPVAQQPAQRAACPS
jgi:hypothetical protein